MPKDNVIGVSNDHFTYFNANPYGRHTGDCVYRAISLFFGWSWSETANDLNSYCCERGLVPNWRQGFGYYLGAQQIKGIGAPKTKKGETFTVLDFIEKFARPGRRYLVAMYGHLTCIIGRKIHDTWDCSARKVQFWWEMPDDGVIRRPFSEKTPHDDLTVPLSEETLEGMGFVRNTEEGCWDYDNREQKNDTIGFRIWPIANGFVMQTDYRTIYIKDSETLQRLMAACNAI